MPFFFTYNFVFLIVNAIPYRLR
ncbi:MAG: hypothetical protein JWQ00_3223, partial [Noviherbaspirillum sp.]|nr:hypothetical protein [Noviherbaspirillum sp.]